MKTMRNLVLFSLLFSSVVFAEDDYVVIQNDRRDPFTFCKTIPKYEEEKQPEVGGVVVPEESHGLSAEQVALRSAEALRDYYAGENWISDNPGESIKQCDSGLNIFADIKTNNYRALSDIRDMLLRLRKAAERIKQRNDAERDFKMIGVRVTGIVSRPQHSQAIINAKIETVGDTLELAGDNTATVSEINPQVVVVIYRGYRMELEISR